MLNTSYQEINRSPLNNSISKQLYSFTKAKRFHDRSPDDRSGSPIYALPTTLSKRAAGIGYGKKVSLTQETITPAPNRYTVKPELQVTLDKKKGWTMAVGREESNKYEGIFLSLSQKTPGPGEYSHRDTLSSIKYSMRKRTESYKNKDKIPGPGDYHLPQGINKIGKYNISKYRDSGAIILSPINSKNGRFNFSRNITPGPGTYKHVGDIDPMGIYYCSKFSDSKANTFTKAKRDTIKTREQSPGPGMYKLPTEFGYYEGNKSTINK